VVTTELGLSNAPPGPDTAPMAEGFVFDPAALPGPTKRIYRADVEVDTDEPAPTPPKKPAPDPGDAVEKDEE
jgi:hypothetical protein